MDGGCEINLRIRKNKMSRKLSEIRNSGSFYFFCGKNNFILSFSVFHSLYLLEHACLRFLLRKITALPGRGILLDTDFLLVRKMRQGNEEAFDVFVRKYYGEILSYCRFRCFDAESAEDLTQETFLRFFANLSEYRHMGKAKNFLYTVAGNLCRDFYKKKKDVPMDGEGLEAQAPLGEDSLEPVLDRAVIRAALLKLPEEFREMIVLHYFQGMKIAEAAEVIGVRVSLAKYRLREAKAQLKRLLE